MSGLEYRLVAVTWTTSLPFVLAPRSLAPEQRYSVRSNLSVLSLLEARAEMPDPVPHRAKLAQLMHGASPLPVGREVSPAKRLFFVTHAQLETLAAREVPVRLTAEFLQATAIALVPHGDGPLPPQTLTNVALSQP
jgi:hypothetical protein